MEVENQNLSAAQKKPRMEWLDAMRGFTMLLVVAYHISTVSYAEDFRRSVYLSFFVMFRMPLFFLVSGFLAYKSRFVWTVSSFGQLAWKKIRIQVFPTIVFLCLFILMICYREGFATAFMRIMEGPTKGGFWFTWVLLQMFLLYYVFAFCEQKLRVKSAAPIAVLWLMSLFAYETLYLPKVFTYHKDMFFSYSSLLETIRYFHFFLLGNIIHRYWDRFQRLFDSSWFAPLMILVALIGCIDYMNLHTLRLGWANLPRTCAMYALVFIVLMFFRYYQAWFTKDRCIGRWMQYVGTRTLDIYLIHYFFFPHMEFVGEWFRKVRPGFVVDTTISLVSGAIVIVFCLITSNLLRMSPLLRKYLFGKD